MSKPEMLLPIGLPASGKTTFAKAWLAEDPDGRIRVNYDEARLARYGPDWIWNRREEEAMKVAVRNTVTDALKAGLSVVVDNTNLSRHVRASWQALAHDHGAEYIEQEIDTPLDVCIARDRLRTSKARVGQAVIDGMALEYGYIDWNVTPEGWRGHRSDGLPIAIVDIDGTVADDNGRLQYLEPDWCYGCRKPVARLNLASGAKGACVECRQAVRERKDWGAYFAEVANDRPIAKMLRLLARLEDDHLIVFVSGRPVSNGATPVGIMTEDWLLKYLVPFNRLFLKTRDFHQQSPDFKRGVLEHLPISRVAYVFEDDNRCVEMYREELKKAGSDGLVMQVAEGGW